MINILNTRAQHQSGYITRCIESIGGSVFQFPVLDIHPVSFSQKNFSLYTIFIFLSANAVNHFFSQTAPEKIIGKIIAIGSATQQALEKYGFSHIIRPKQFSSEGILELPLLQHNENQSVFIISGEDSKPLLPETLKIRGIFVETVSCYRRTPHQYDMTVIFPTLEQHKIDVIISASLSSLHQLIALFEKPPHAEWLLSKKLCVVSEVMQHAAISAGFQFVVQSENATDDAVFTAIKKLLL